MTRLPVLLGTAVLLAAGCDDPYDNTSRDRPRAGEPTAPALLPESPAAEQRPTGTGQPELPAPPRSGQLPGQVPAELRDDPDSFPTASATPERTLARAADLYGNWTSATASRRFEQIAALSIGQARAELRQAAAQSGSDPQQQQVTSRSRLAAIDVDGQDDRRQGLVVTRQKVQGPGLPDAEWRYQITLAVVERRADKWVIAQWRPQP
jgi:hypothetical protein